MSFLAPVPVCKHCGAPTLRSRLVEATGDVAAVLGVRVEASVCDTCEGRAERELDDAEEAIALSDDPDFATVLDARRDGWIAAHEAEGAALDAAVAQVSP